MAYKNPHGSNCLFLSLYFYLAPLSLIVSSAVFRGLSKDDYWVAMSEHYGPLHFTVPLKSLDSYGAQPSCLVPSGPARTRLSGRGRGVLMSEPSVHRAHFFPPPICAS